MMKLSRNIITSGFALVEVVFAMVITGAVSLSMLYIFSEANHYLIKENTRAEVINYCNEILDEIVDSLRVCDDYQRGQYAGFQQLVINTMDDEDNTISTVYKFDQRYGFLRNSNPIKHYFNKDEQRQEQFKLVNWGCRVPSADPGEDEKIRLAKNYCFMDVEVMDDVDDNKVVETLSFKREVFSSTLFIKSLGI